MEVVQSEVKEHWTFFGQVVPERLYLSIVLDQIGAHREGLAFRATIKIHNSQIIASVEVVEGDGDIFTLRNEVEACCRVIADLIGFKCGLAVGIDIISCINEKGDWRVFGTEIPYLFSKKGDGLKELDATLLMAAMADFGATSALADFREAMRLPLQTGFFCYRAVEAMMQTMKLGSDERDSAAWARFRESLKIGRDVLDELKSHADWARHGKPGVITSDQRGLLFSITDELIERYLRYVIAGRQILGEMVAKLTLSSPEVFRGNL